MAEPTGSPRPISDDELGEALTRLGAELDYPAPTDLPDQVRERLRAEAERPRGWRNGLGWRDLLDRRPRVPGSGRPAWQPLAAVVALVLIVFAASLVAFPGVREAVADWLGLRGIGITVVPTLSPIPTNYRSLVLGHSATLDEARSAVTWQVLVPTDPLPGPPDEVYLEESRADPVVSLVWGARPGLPVASATGAGLLLTEFRGSIDQQLFQKILGPGTTIEPVHIDGAIGYWISGAPHEFYVRDGSGQPIVQSIRLAGDVLMWEEGDLTLRLEGELNQQDALRIAASTR